MSQSVPSQVAIPCAGGDGHGAVHRLPHELTLVLSRQMPLQLWKPLSHMSLQAAVLSMQAPLHGFFPVGQAGTQATPLQLTLPPVGAWQAVHDVCPHVAGSLLLTQRLPHLCQPDAHMRSQPLARHTAVPFGSVGQAMQPVPQAVASSLAAQRLPQRW
jgi:hypothetical protein